MSSLTKIFENCNACQAYQQEGVAPSCDDHKYLFKLDQELEKKYQEAKKLADQLGNDRTEESYVI